MKITTIELPIYEVDIIVVIDSWEEANKQYDLRFIEEDYDVDGWTIHTHGSLKTEEILVMLKSSTITYNVICHEVFHCVSAVCKKKGIIMDIENDEPLAYLQGYIAEKIFEFRDNYLKQNNKENKK